MEEVGITQRGVGKNRNPYYAATDQWPHILDGKDFLRFVNDGETHWEVNLGASYRTEYWQLQDDKQQNSMFKLELALSKSKFYLK